MSAEPVAAAREKREKKQVERLEVANVKEDKEDFKIEKGAGEKLGDIENVVFKIAKLNSQAEELKALHRLCFGKPGQKNTIKKNLREFSGLVSDNMKADKDKKAASMAKNTFQVKLIKGMLDVCDLSPTGTKAQLIERLLDWLEKPEASGKRSLVEKAGEKRKQAEKKKEKVAKTKGKTAKAKGGKQKVDKPTRAPTAYILYCNSRREKVRAENPSAGMTEITKILAEKWKGISDERKAKYEAQAKELKAELDAKKAKATAEPPAKKQKKEKAEAQV